MKAKELRPNPQNPRKINDHQLVALEKAMREFGDLGGVIKNKKTGNIIGGHQRVKILAQGDCEVVIEKKYEKPTSKGTVAEGYVVYDGEKFSYREVEWPAKKEKIAIIAANKHGGEWDMRMLSDMLIDLDTGDIDMDLTGYSELELEDMMTYMPEGKTEEDIEEEKAMKETPPVMERIMLFCSVDQYKEFTSVMVEVKKKIGIENDFESVLYALKKLANK